jgi:hypothetical protein
VRASCRSPCQNSQRRNRTTRRKRPVHGAYSGLGRYRVRPRPKPCGRITPFDSRSRASAMPITIQAMSPPRRMSVIFTLADSR